MRAGSPYKKGLTIIELLVVFALIAILAAVIVSPFSSFKKKSVLNVETQEILTTFNKARQSTIFSKNDQQYGVYLASDRIVLFSGTSYSTSTSSNETHVFDSSVKLSPITINGGGSVVVFDKITGATSQYATTTLSIVGSSTSSSTIVVYPSGIAAVQ